MAEKPALRIENLRFRYHPRRKSEPWVVDIYKLALARGEQMLLTGKSGHGKSTLLHLIAGLMDPVEGETYVDGTPIHALRGAQRDLFRGKRIGMIFQSFNLLHGFSALDNVLAAMMFSSIPRREHRKRALKLLKHLGIDHPRRYPEKMSIGQQQRVAVARAVACDPVLVLADEPTASLDPDNANKAIALIQTVCREKNAALLCVSHDPTLCERFERRASLDDLGRDKAKGPVVTQEKRVFEPSRPAVAPPLGRQSETPATEIPMESEREQDVPKIPGHPEQKSAKQDEDDELDLEGNAIGMKPMTDMDHDNGLDYAERDEPAGQGGKKE